MQILIIHLSDMHIQKKDRVDSSLVAEIGNCINSRTDAQFDEVILAFTGDLTKTASLDEFIKAKEVLDSILSAIECKVKIAIVPGNHDIKIDKSKSYQSIMQSKSELNDPDVFENELAQMDGFFLIANEYGLYLDNRLFDEFEFPSIEDDKNVHMLLLNTAPLSTRHQDDKQLHNAPSAMIEAFREKRGDSISIVLMHHDYDWFDDESKRYLQNALTARCDLLLCGHNHDNKTDYLKTDSEKTLHILRGGEIDITGYKESTFSIYELDIDNLDMNVEFLRWNRQDSVFTTYRKTTEKIIVKDETILRPRDHYINAIDENGLCGKDIFTFPGVFKSIESGPEGKRLIESSIELFEVISDRKLVNIIGKSQSGKTSILREMYRISVDQGFSPIYLDKNNNRPSLSYLIPELIAEQYGQFDADKSRFDQIKIDKKILFIDDFDKIKKKSKDSVFLDKLLKHVGHIVITSSTPLEDSFLEDVKASLDIENHIDAYHIRDFYKESRDKLVTKVCSFLGHEDLAEEISIIIDKGIHRHRLLYRLSPDYIIQNIFYFVNNNGIADHADDAPFSIIFEANTAKKVEAACKKLKNELFGRDAIEPIVQQIMALLAVVAFEMHTGKDVSISTNDFNELVNEYIREYGLSIDAHALLSVSVKAGIVTRDLKHNIRFTSINYHSYFVAKRINSLIHQRADVSEDLRYLLENICFDVNECILLFLSYLREDIQFTMSILDSLNKILKDIEPLSFDNENIAFFSKTASSNVAMMTSDRKKAHNKLIGENEEAMEDQLITYNEIYDYDESQNCSKWNNALRASRYLEMLGRLLISQFALLRQTEKEEIAAALYEFPNRLLFCELKELDNLFDDFANYLYEELEEDGITREMVVDALIRVALAECLSKYDSIAYSSINAVTLPVLTDINAYNTNHRIQRLIMIENAQDSERFLNCAIADFERADQSNNTTEKILIRGIVNKHLSEHRSIPNRMLQKTTDKVFAGKDYKKRLQVNKSRAGT